MKRFITILLALFLMTSHVYSIDITGSSGNIASSIECPTKFLEGTDKTVISKKWLKLSLSQKELCEERMRQLSVNKKINNAPGMMQVVVVLIIISLFILFVFREPIQKIINSKTSNIKDKQQANKNKAISQNTNPIQSKKVKPKKEILSWDEPLKSEPKKEEPAKEEPQPAKATITADEEEEIYAKIGKELKENRNEGAWLKAYTESDGDEQKAKIAYINNRAKVLMEELKESKKKN